MPNFTINDSDEKFMRRALELALQGCGRVSPNPLVGCVIAKGGRIIAGGFHGKFGGPHAEADALGKAGAEAAGADAYVTLEPCVRFEGKKTPSCAEAVVKAGVKRVFVAVRDPNPNVAGKGIELLKQAGVEVVEGICGDDAGEANKFFFKFVRTKRPYVILKMAVSLDGKIWSPETSSISNPQFAGMVQKLRNDCDAILVGSGTVITDNPRLTCRMPQGRDPLRAIVDCNLESPVNSKVFNDANCAVFCLRNADGNKRKALEKRGIRIIETEAGEDGDRLNLERVFATLGEMKITSVLVEGGRKIASSVVREGLYDECVLAIAPKILGEGTPAFESGVEIGFGNASVQAVGDNAVFTIRKR